MSPLFGKKKSQGKTTVLLDIENGSVGGALLRTSSSEAPRLFGETRVRLPMLFNRDHQALSAGVEKAIRQVLEQVHMVAARLRNHEQAYALGEINRVVVFLGAPWGVPNLEARRSNFAPGIQDFLLREIELFAPHAPLSYYTGADASAYGFKVLYPNHEGVLLCSVGGEIVELLHLSNKGAEGYATIPHGYQTLLRTLMTHGGLSLAEARSVFSLMPHESIGSHAAVEALGAASSHFAEQFGATTGELLKTGNAGSVYVLTHEPVGDWFAQTLASSDSVSELFPQGSLVRSLGTHHVSPYLASHGSRPDLYLLLEALYVDGQDSHNYTIN